MIKHIDMILESAARLVDKVEQEAKGPGELMFVESINAILYITKTAIHHPEVFAELVAVMQKFAAEHEDVFEFED